MLHSQRKVRYAATHRLFLQHGYLAVRIDVIRAGRFSSKETYDSRNAYKETLFVGVLNYPVMEQPGFSGRLFGLCALHDLPSLCQALTYVSHKTLSNLEAGPVLCPWCG